MKDECNSFIINNWYHGFLILIVPYSCMVWFTITFAATICLYPFINPDFIVSSNEGGLLILSSTKSLLICLCLFAPIISLVCFYLDMYDDYNLLDFMISPILGPLISLLLLLFIFVSIKRKLENVTFSSFNSEPIKLTSGKDNLDKPLTMDEVDWIKAECEKKFNINFD